MSDNKPARSGLSLPFARIALILAGLVALAAIGLTILRSRAPVGDSATVSPTESQAPVGDVKEAIANLERKLADNPKDPAGWQLLGWSYYNVGRYADAAKAYGRAAELEPQVADHWSALGEAQLLSGPGGVTPQAEASFRKALAIDPKDFRSRYFMGVKKDADGDHKAALDDWIDMLRDAPPGAPWEGAVRDLIAKVSAANKIDVANRVPPPSADPAPMPMQAQMPTDVASAAIPGPTPEQLRSASNLTPSQQDDMAKAMVARLAARLEADPRDADGWIRLMRARMVLNDPQAASAAMQRARAVFANDAGQRARIDDAAKTLGIPIR